MILEYEQEYKTLVPTFYYSNQLKNKKYHTVGTFLKYHTVGTFLKYHTVGTILKYHTVGTILKYHTVGTIPKSNIKVVERKKSISLTHKFMTAHFLGLVQTLQ